MKDRIRIVNWLLTRKCNLDCSYCAIVKNYENKPAEYPDMKYYFENEMCLSYVLQGLKKIKIHNPDCFHIFYGGEPMLRKDLPDIINYCNEEDIHYTIITNNTPGVQSLILELIEKTSYIQGLTSSVDPVIFNGHDTSATDRVSKSIEGLRGLIEHKGHINDVVAEITVMHSNVRYLYDLIKKLSEHEINGDITFVDIAKTQYYDFSNVTNRGELVEQTEELAVQLMHILADDSLDVHMKKFLIPKIWSILPSNMDCGIENDLHNITIDADGSVRLCLRIRGRNTPDNISVNKNLFDKQYNISEVTKLAIKIDKKELCRLCNHTCLLMSKYGDQVDDLVHLDCRRR